MKRLIVFAILFFIACSGCTLSFKAEKLELESERQRVQNNDTYELEAATFL